MEQNGGSDAQLFHDRSRSRNAAAGAGTICRGGFASGAGEPSQEKQGLVATSIPVTGDPADADLAKHVCWRVARAAPCAASGHLLIESFVPLARS